MPKFGQKWIFLEKRALSGFQYSNYLPLCLKSEKPNEPFLRKLLGGTPKTSLFYWFLCETRPILESFNWLKNPAIWLANSILGHILETRIFSNMKFVQVYSNYHNINFHYWPNWEKIKELRKKKLNFPMHSKNPSSEQKTHRLTTILEWIYPQIHRFASTSFTLISVYSKVFWSGHKLPYTSLFFTSINDRFKKRWKQINMSNSPPLEILVCFHRFLVITSPL